MNTPLSQRLDFLMEIDQLKSVVRRNFLADGSRRENTAEHSWHLVLFAMTLFEHSQNKDLDQLRVLKMCALHDLVEIYAGDTFLWDEKGNEGKYDREKAASIKLFGLLPAPQGEEFRLLWEEFEEGQTPEAIYANGIDRIAPVLLNSQNGAVSWRENGVTAPKLRAKMAAVAQAVPELAEVLETIIQKGLEKGDLLP